jgi:hypothetical protein
MHVLRGIGCVVVAAVIWIGCLHVWFERDPEAVARPLARRQLELWERGGPELEDSLRALRRENPEWDLMARTFAVLAFANLALRDGDDRYLAAIDAIVDRTLRELEQHGTHHFLLAYSRDRPFVDREARSLFVDGELALMLAARELVKPRRPALAREWADRARAQIERSPVLLGESYPDEVWLFCNAVALAAVRLHDASEGARDRHAGLFARWVASAKATVVDRETGLLVAKTDAAGQPLEGPEGSTLWLVAAMLRVVDDDFARDQYTRARAALGDRAAGFAWAREWPASWPGGDDIDSGPTIPIVEASAGSSGLALVGAQTFGDNTFARELLATLQLAAFPVDGGASYAAGNQLADAVILYALVAGPLWERAR